MLAKASYPTQLLTFWFAVVIPVALLALVIGSALYRARRGRRPPP
ncbi:MAG TPA: hypothetical protein VFA29_13730 [Candidatus Baltobacteraceae bacterium]|nr:hypothetical protein [Candidatus Baltobacteraceae bacterium]